ncbi:MAG: putative baseplate assembly protein [Candidatus Aminicenantes bacterium]|nr:putative baseplate assembly protein [Candidatus Aminicenantes bacterium]NIM81861.1 putative baseplate assembly protein [Candidatus Aminicenantes bacterium]NIN21238.1 putative baseplate assembly protein [Candidatus Aminicenantes bacterium]NIN45059.1 putative baseplate assembly protein [Candidatus Aminicenantes bacterium]NIN87876.1 putative baseplate assembly protein [Candidatus Aminicenantes bacterium]
MSLPIPKLDDRTFAELVEEARKLIPIYTPRWTNHNLSDPGMTLMDLFAWLTEMQLYNLDFISEAHLLKYLALLGMRPRPASEARVELQLELNGDESNVCITVPKGTHFKTDSSTFALTFESEEEIEVIPIVLKKVVSYSNYRFIDVTGFNDSAKTYFHAFGEHPRERDALYLGFDLKISLEDLAGKTLRLAVYPYEDDLPPVGEGLPGEDKSDLCVSPAAEAVWEVWKSENKDNGGNGDNGNNGNNGDNGDNGDKEGWVPLTVTAADENVPVLSRQGFLSFDFPEGVIKLIPNEFPQNLKDELKEIDLLLWIRCRLKKAGYEIPPRIDRILPNVVSAVEGETLEDEWESSGLPHQVFKTRKYPIVPGSQTINIEDATWEAVMDFDVSGPGDPHYVMEPTKGEIRFSNGINGAIPTKGKKITISYRSGGGIKGNIKANTIKGTDVSGINVDNPYPAYGGEDAEPVKNAYTRLKRNLGISYTAVTAGDYEYIAKATPGLRVARARAVIIGDDGVQKSTGNLNEEIPFNEVIVVVIPYSFLEKPLPGESFKQAVCRYLELHRLIATAIKVSDPDYVRVSVTGEIKVKPGYDAEQIKKRTSDALDHFLSPLKRESGDNEWPFGRAVYCSEINEILEGVEGVDCVTAISLYASGGSFARREGNIEIGPLSLVYPGTHEIRVIDPYEKCRVTEEQSQND